MWWCAQSDYEVFLTVYVSKSVLVCVRGSTLPLHHSMSADCLSDMTPGHTSPGHRSTDDVDDGRLRDVDDSLTEQQLVLNHISQVIYQLRRVFYFLLRRNLC